MSIYAISDLHLALSLDKPMNVFGDNWNNHHLKIRDNWNNLVHDNDLVIVSGDISWAMNLNDAKLDLDFVNTLKGTKILGYGNHDYWWNSTNKLNEMYENIIFLRNSTYTYGKYIICAIKGSVCPKDTFFSESDRKLYNRETKKLENVLSIASKHSDLEIIVMLHYPPTNDNLENSLYMDILRKYNVNTVIYGHVHNNFDNCLKGVEGDIEYFLTSSDYLNFKPILIKQ